MLGWAPGAWRAPTDLARLFRLRTTRALDADGSVRFRHWRLYGARGLAGERAAVGMAGERLAIAFRAEALIPRRVALAPAGHRLREVADPAPLPHGHPSPPPCLGSLDTTPWRPARKLAPYRPRRKRSPDLPRERPFAADKEVMTRCVTSQAASPHHASYVLNIALNVRDAAVERPRYHVAWVMIPLDFARRAMRLADDPDAEYLFVLTGDRDRRAGDESNLRAWLDPIVMRLAARRD